MALVYKNKGFLPVWLSVCLALLKKKKSVSFSHTLHLPVCLSVCLSVSLSFSVSFSASFSLSPSLSHSLTLSLMDKKNPCFWCRMVLCKSKNWQMAKHFVLHVFQSAQIVQASLSRYIVCNSINSYDKILDYSKLKSCADNKINVIYNWSLLKIE